jgi:hypothetical protein
MRVHRDPFEPIMAVLEADSPLAEYRKITDEILKRMPDEDRYPATRVRYEAPQCPAMCIRPAQARASYQHNDQSKEIVHKR